MLTRLMDMFVTAEINTLECTVKNVSTPSVAKCMLFLARCWASTFSTMSTLYVVILILPRYQRMLQ